MSDRPIKPKKVEGLSPEIIDLIRVTPEQTEEFYERTVKYKRKPAPEDEKPHKGKMWCSYCGKWSLFSAKDIEGSYARAECCGISTEDFWIKTDNKLWSEMR